jgi:NADH dehydrogenase
MNTPLKTDILILGAGIGGYETFRTLQKLLKRNKIKKTITIIDQNNYFTFVPLLHEAATGSVEPDHCAIPMRELVHSPHQFIKTSVKHIDPDKKHIETTTGTIEYEYCIVALGSRVSYYGVPGAEEYSYHVRSLPGALDIQKKIVKQLEQQKKNDWAITVVGGGATGVELAGQLADLVHHDAKTYYPKHTIHIQLVHAAKTLVPREDPQIQRAAEIFLKKAGVQLHLEMHVAEVKKDAVILLNKKRLESDITIWAGGNDQKEGSYLDTKHSSGGQIPVNAFLTHKKFPSLYAVGDIAKEEDPKTGESYPQLGETAHKEGIYVAKHITQTILQKPTKPFSFRSLGTLIAIGDKHGIGKIGPFFFTGWFAWWMRRTVYVNFMPKISRKIRIIIDWTLRLFGPRYIIDIENGSGTHKKS